MAALTVHYYDLAIAAALVLASMVVSWRLQLGLERDLVMGAVRSFVQLALVGFVLGYLIRNQQWYLTLPALAIMLAVAVHTASGRVKEPLARKGWVFTVALVVGSLLVLAFVTGAVLRLPTWYNPQYVLPLAGMIIGNAMNAATLAVGRFAGDLERRRPEVESALALGASALQAVHPIRRDALRTAIIPAVNGMLVVGVVSLPGMMTGQIIAGQDPSQAVLYQVVVMYMITAAASLTSVIALAVAVRQSFTPAQQLRVG
jgi:putative ABC transport system permease protein